MSILLIIIIALPVIRLLWLGIRQKDIKKSIEAVLFLLMLLGFAYYATQKNHDGKETKKESKYLKETGFVHGTIYNITYESPEGQSYQKEYEKEFKNFDLSLSTFEKNSIISRINRNEKNVILDDNFKTVFNAGEQISKHTDGAFDMTVAPLVNAWGFGFDKHKSVTEAEVKEIMKNMGYWKVKIQNNRLIKQNNKIMLDASAIAKGYSSDVVARLLEKHGVKNYMVEIGGECAIKGKNAKGERWSIGITKPQDDSTQNQQEIQNIVFLNEGGLATSGNYRQFYYKNGKKYAHTIDPKTGHPVNHSLLSATIHAKDCMTADAYATACMVMGVEKSIKLIEATPGLEGYFIYSDKKNKYDTKMTSGFKKFLEE